MAKKPLTPARFALALVVFGVAAVFGLLRQNGTQTPEAGPNASQTSSERARETAPGPRTEARPSASPPKNDGAIERAFAQQRSDVLVEASGRVKKTLPDDNEGSRHQKFIVQLPSGHTVLIAHNIDLAPRVPLDEGDTVTFAGEYEHTAQGGVVHWTHHDPGGRHKGGWIDHDGTRYE